MRVAIQGTHGSFSESAAKWRWPDATIVPCREVREVVAAVRSDRADAGCLAIENSLFGSVTATYDLLHDAFGDGALHLSDEILLPVFHALLGVPGTPLADIRRVLSHPVALGQCRIWLEAHLPQAELVSEWDTAGSAEIVARDGRGDQAAIAPLGAGGAYGLAALAERIEDDPSNQTRFLTFTREPVAPAAPGSAPIRRKTSLLLWLPHKPGMLAAALQAFASRGVNLTSLQSRPERTAPWTYRFYVDVEGAPDEPRLAEAIESTEALVTKLVVLGSYREWNDGTAPSPAPTPPPAHHRPKPDMPLFDRRQKPGRHADHGARRRDRRRPARPDGRALFGRGRRDAPRGRDLRRPGGRRHAPRRGLQAAHVAVRLPGPRRARSEVSGRGAGEDRPAGGHGGSLLGGGSRRRPLRRRAADRRAQHAELRAAARGGPRRQADPPEAGRRRHDSRSGSRRPSTSSPTAIPRSSCASGASGRSSGRHGTRST